MGCEVRPYGAPLRLPETDLTQPRIRPHPNTEHVGKDPRSLRGASEIGRRNPQRPAHLRAATPQLPRNPAGITTPPASAASRTSRPSNHARCAQHAVRHHKQLMHERHNEPDTSEYTGHVICQGQSAPQAPVLPRPSTRSHRTPRNTESSGRPASSRIDGNRRCNAPRPPGAPSALGSRALARCAEPD